MFLNSRLNSNKLLISEVGNRILSIMTETRNILIIGRTRNGKSSLANTLVNKGGILKQVFKESNRSVSSTKKSQNEVFN